MALRRAVYLLVFFAIVFRISVVKKRKNAICINGGNICRKIGP